MSVTEAWLSPAQIAEELGISIDELDRLAQLGCPFVSLDERSDIRRFRMSDVRAWLDDRDA